MPSREAAVQKPLSDDDLGLIDGWWRACSLSVGMIYLIDNPLLGSL